MPKIKGGPGPLAVLFAGLEFGGRKLQGQTNLQAGVGTAASTAGGLGGAAAGAAIGTALFPGVGTLVGGLIGGMIAANVAGGAADMITGANKPQQLKEN